MAKWEGLHHISIIIFHIPEPSHAPLTSLQHIPLEFRDLFKCKVCSFSFDVRATLKPPKHEAINDECLPPPHGCVYLFIFVGLVSRIYIEFLNKLPVMRVTNVFCSELMLFTSSSSRAMLLPFRTVCELIFLAHTKHYFFFTRANFHERLNFHFASSEEDRKTRKIKLSWLCTSWARTRPINLAICEDFHRLGCTYRMAAQFGCFVMWNTLPEWCHS